MDALAAPRFATEAGHCTQTKSRPSANPASVSRPNALTPEQVKKARTVKVAGSKRKHTFKEQTTHMILQNLQQPGSELDLPGHKIAGSGRSMIHIKYRELDTKNNQFLFHDVSSAYVEYMSSLLGPCNRKLRRDLTYFSMSDMLQ